MSFTNIEELENAINEILPNASFGTDNDGQIIIYTDLKISFGVLQDLDG